MRTLVRASAVLALFLALPAGAQEEASTASAPPTAQIVELLADPDPAASQREFIEILNPGSEALALAGWTLTDLAGNRFTFPAWSVDPGRRVVVWGGGDADSNGPVWSAASTWNNAGDTATLADATGVVVDWFSYGSARTGAAPEGYSSTGHPAAAPKGSAMSMSLDAAWSHASPTPGLPPGATGGSATVMVENVAPEVAFTSVPPSAVAGTVVSIAFSVTDANGGDDIASWRLSGNGADIALATGGGAFEHDATAPGAGPWELILRATDSGGKAAEATWTVDVRTGGLRLAMPEGGRLLFPALVPGAANVTSTGGFTLHNDGETLLFPRFDLSDFRGAGVLAVEGNVWIDVTTSAAGATTTAHVLYEGPLTSLPEIPVGAQALVILRILSVPLPLPTGSYGTSFSVVA